MSTFQVLVQRLTIEPHPNADTLELAVIGDYRSCVRKGQFKTGDLGVYIPEASVLPDWVIEKLGLTGKLAGAQHNRVKAMKLRSILSQGLVYPLVQKMHCWLLEDIVVAEGEEVGDQLGITKWEPPIPVHMAGEVWNAFGYTVKYDIENLKKFPDIFKEGERVIFTEKLHGTFCCVGFHPDLEDYIVHSKGLGGQGLAFKLNEANANNLYVKVLKQLEPTLDKIRASQPTYNKRAVYVLGEIFGKGVQDLTYGQDKPAFRVFDVYDAEFGYLGEDLMDNFCDVFELERVPQLYSGPFSKAVVDQYTNGRETLSGKNACLREGIVIRPGVEARSDLIGRVILKSVSEAYLLRKGEATEFN